MTCENCGAPMRLSRDQGLMICDYCGGQTTPPTDEDGVVVLEPTKHNCPVCATAWADAHILVRATIDSHELLYCTSCHGMLLEMENFLPLVDVLREYRNWSRSSLAQRKFDAREVLGCPLCQHEMDRHLYGGGGNVEVDSCEQCSVLWLDRGELSRIVAAPDRDVRTAYQGYDAPASPEPDDGSQQPVLPKSAKGLKVPW